MTKLETLRFQLNEKTEELKSINLTQFTLNTHIKQLIDEINDITEQIKKLEDTKNA